MPLFAKKKYLKLAQGFYGRGKNCYTVAIPRVERSLQHAYRNRRLRLRGFRTEWITTVSGALHQHDINYSRMINLLNHSNIQLDRKILSQLAQQQPYSFKAILDELKAQGSYIPKPAQHSLMDGYKMGLLIDSKEVRPQNLKYRNKPIDLRLRDPRRHQVEQDFRREQEQIAQKEKARLQKGK